MLNDPGMHSDKYIHIYITKFLIYITRVQKTYDIYICSEMIETQ